MERLESGPLFMPFFDRREIQLALVDGLPVGFAHVGFGPDPSGSGLSSNIGHIAVVAVAPETPEPVVVCQELIQAGEAVLLQSGSHVIYGGSPRPSLPFYLGLYGGAESIGIFDSDWPVGKAFRLLGYGIHQKTVRFQRELTDYFPPFTPSMLRWKSKLQLDINDCPSAKNWWDALSLAQYDWIELTAIHKETHLPVAQVRVRLDTQGNAALTDLRVRPDFHRQGVGTYILAETLRRMIAQNNAACIEAHIAGNCSPLHGLLKILDWKVVETGTIFIKKVS